MLAAPPAKSKQEFLRKIARLLLPGFFPPVERLKMLCIHREILFLHGGNPGQLVLLLEEAANQTGKTKCIGLLPPRVKIYSQSSLPKLNINRK